MTDGSATVHALLPLAMHANGITSPLAQPAMLQWADAAQSKTVASLWRTDDWLNLSTRGNCATRKNRKKRGFMLAGDVMYGNWEVLFRQLLQTVRDLASEMIIDEIHPSL